MKNIVYLPLDERPCNYNFAEFLCEGSNEINLIRPDLSVLGDKKTPAEFNGVKEFLLENAKTADYLICSVDMLLYGGIVPSRLHRFSEEELSKRLDLLRVVKEENPKLKIYAFALVMRCPCYSTSEEEPDYYGVCGEELFLYGQNEHKRLLNAIDEETYLREKQKLYKKCGAYLDDFLTRRKVNVELVKKTLSLVGNVIDYFIVPQDDSNPLGFTAMDQADVKKTMKENGVAADVYPGADEVGLTLLARALTDIKGYSPKIFPVYPKEECKNVIPTYEDREFYKTLALQIKNAGAILADDAKTADVLLYCNLPVGEMKNTMFQFGKSYDLRELDKFIDKLCADVKKGKAVAVADVAYLNGGDIELTETISQKIGLLSLAGYSGWNTSSNSLGTVICQSVFYNFFGKTAAHLRFIAERIYEDVAYCSVVRRDISENYLPSIGCDYTRADGVRGKASKEVLKKINDYMQNNYPEIFNAYKITDCYLPWNRAFEVGLIVTER